MSEMQKQLEKVGFEDIVKGILLAMRAGLIPPKEARTQILETLRVIREGIANARN